MADENAEDRELMTRLQAWLRWEQKRRGISQNALGGLLGYQSGTMTKRMDPHGQIPGVGFVLRVYRLLHEADISARELLTEQPGSEDAPASSSPPQHRPFASPPRHASSRPQATRRKTKTGEKSDA